MTDPIAKYKSKRKFDDTPEPEGKKAKGRNRYRFVIQLHHAKKAGDHYDLRLENDNGVLSSWSIPKHRLPKGKEKLLAVETEDHPVEYLKFKGEIPSGYGAGTVEIRDSGTYDEIEHSATKILFRLKGKREKGTYRLFRAGKDKKWLIMEGTGDKEASALFPLSKHAKKHTGAMLAIMAPPAIVRKMRKAGIVEDRDISDCLHLTLLYLGPSAKLNKTTLSAIIKAAEKVCSRHSPLKMRIAGAGLFTPEDDGTPVYVIPNAKGLSALQADLENVIGSIIDLPSEHGWVPHMTVGYSCDDKPELPNLVEKLEWTADKVRLQAGGEKVADIPIGRRKKGEDEPPLSKYADQAKEKPLFRQPAPSMWKGVWEKHEDPVKHVRESKPVATLPHNIPDWDVVTEGLETSQIVPPDTKDMEPSDPNGHYYVIDAMDRIVARYGTKEKAIQNAENAKWAYRVMYSEYADPWDAVVYEEKPVVWEKPTEYLKELRESVQEGPYYLMDYWGRQLASYADLDQAIRNAERNMYVSHVVASLTGDIYGGKTVWSKPETAATQASAMLPFSKRAVLERLPIHHDPAMWTDEQLTEAVGRPELFGNDQERYRAAVEQLTKRGLVKKVEPKDAGKWLEHGRFILFWGGSLLAVYRTHEHAERASSLLAGDFADMGSFPKWVAGGSYGQREWIIGNINHRAAQNIGQSMGFDPDMDDYLEGKRWANKEAERLLSPSVNAKGRKAYAESALNIVPLPADIDVPETDCSTADRPDVKDRVVSDRMRNRLLGKSDPGRGFPEERDLGKESKRNEREGQDRFIEQAVKTVEKRLKARRAGLDPDKLADDDWTDEDDVAEMALLADDLPLSQRAKTYQ